MHGETVKLIVNEVGQVKQTVTPHYMWSHSRKRRLS